MNEAFLLEQLKKMLASVHQRDAEAAKAARERWKQVAKPLRGLGILEDVIVEMAGIQRCPEVDMEKCACLVLCADHGVVREGCAQTGSHVTRLVAENMAAGEGCINIMAKRAGADVFVVDMGMDCEPFPSRDLVPAGRGVSVTNRKIARGSENIVSEPAMSTGDCTRAILTGIEMSSQLHAMGYKLICSGEMGIGNTTAGSALCAVLLSRDPAEVTGPGAGLDDEALALKKELVGRAVDRYWRETEKTRIVEDEFFQVNSSLELMSQLGGYEIAGMAGLCIGAAIYGVTVILDGFLSTVSALCAALMCPVSRGYLLASHLSAEPAAASVLGALGLSPVIHAEMKLGEGTGAVSALHLYKNALDIYMDMKSFDELRVERYKDYDGDRRC